MSSNHFDIPPYMNVSVMSKLLGLSRSRLYQLITEGVILQPVYLIANRRPVFTREMALCNLRVKEQNVGVNGQVIMFYTSRRNDSPVARSKPSPVEKMREKETRSPQVERHMELIEALEALGIENIKVAQIDSAIRKCFPDGAENIGEDEILREVFRQLQCQNPEHKPRT
ncbi:MAG: hypothetical protein IH624_14385 [Phycisphaerae bacterium]|nr:hypothetical protein [Phycisphaerae bacterium]